MRELLQLDGTYDVYGMSGQPILELLPPEFDPWREGSRDGVIRSRPARERGAGLAI